MERIPTILPRRPRTKRWRNLPLIHSAEGIDDMGFFAHRPDRRSHHFFDARFALVSRSVLTTRFKTSFSVKDADRDFIIGDDDASDVLGDHLLHDLENRRGHSAP